MTQKIEQSFYPLTIAINRKLRTAKLTTLEKLHDLEAACLEFEIEVTGEEV